MHHFIPRKSVVGNPIRSQHDKRDFIAFYHESLYPNGRKVYIDTALLPKFLSLINPDSFEGQMIVKHIIQLSATAGGFNANQNQASPSIHMDKVRHVQIVYQITQIAKPDSQNANNTVSAGYNVFIIDIRPAFDSDGFKAGLYHIKGDGRSEWNSANYSRDDFGVMSSGTDENLRAAAKEANSWVGKNDWGTQNDYSLFYSPGYIYNDLGAWLTPEMKNYSPDAAAQKLAACLQATQQYRENHGKAEPIKWYVVGEASKLMRLAVNKFKGRLDKHGFKFIDPTTDISPLIRNLRYKGAKISDKNTVTVTNKRKSAQLAMSKVGKNISSAMEELGSNFKPAARQLASESAALERTLGAAFRALKSREVNTFLDAVKRAKQGAKW